jgi:hypothetical protein
VSSMSSSSHRCTRRSSRLRQFLLSPRSRRRQPECIQVRLQMRRQRGQTRRQRRKDQALCGGGESGVVERSTGGLVRCTGSWSKGWSGSLLCCDSHARIPMIRCSSRLCRSRSRWTVDRNLSAAGRTRLGTLEPRAKAGEVEHVTAGQPGGERRKERRGEKMSNEAREKNRKHKKFRGAHACSLRRRCSVPFPHLLVCPTSISSLHTIHVLSPSASCAAVASGNLSCIFLVSRRKWRNFSTRSRSW